MADEQPAGWSKAAKIALIVALVAAVLLVGLALLADQFEPMPFDYQGF